MEDSDAHTLSISPVLAIKEFQQLNTVFKSIPQHQSESMWVYCCRCVLLFYFIPLKMDFRQCECVPFIVCRKEMGMIVYLLACVYVCMCVYWMVCFHWRMNVSHQLFNTNGKAWVWVEKPNTNWNDSKWERIALSFRYIFFFYLIFCFSSLPCHLCVRVG